MAKGNFMRITIFVGDFCVHDFGLRKELDIKGVQCGWFNR